METSQKIKDLIKKDVDSFIFTNGNKKLIDKLAD